MPSTILSDNGVTSNTSGIKVAGSNDGILELQTTTAGGAVTTAMTINTSQAVTFAQTANLPNTFGFKNRIINGGMTIDQRNAGASVTINSIINTYSIDRWYGYGQPTDGVYTLQQDAGAVTPPAGFTDYLGATVTTADASIGATQVYRITQAIEGFNTADLGWGTANAKTITLSFWVRSSLTGTFGGSLGNSAFNRAYPFSYTISAANTWEQKSVTIAGDTTGTWLTTNGAGINVSFVMGMGSTFVGTPNAWNAGTFFAPTGGTNVISTNGATLYITGVQLEAGSTATSFDYRDYGRELAMCQRYLPKVGFDTDDQIGVGQATGSGTWAIQIPHIVQPRVAPTGISAGAASNFNVINSTASGVAVTAINFSAGGLSGSRVTGSVSSGLTAGNATILRAQNSSGFILFTGCEL
jgi:hypothetical protein